MRWKLDKNGNGNYTDSGEVNERRTHSKANEITSRDTNASSPAEHTLSQDATGNTTDDGKLYKYEYDVFGRLMRIRNQSNALVAEYSYYGNGYRASEKYDTDNDHDVDGSDLTYYFAYDDAWRLVATFRSSDSFPKEQFVPHLAGPGGTGSSSQRDAVALRNRDANAGWTSACDGTLEERVYYCQNWRGDVVAVLTDTGAQVEEVRYSPYGEPFGMYAGDVDDDGDVDSTDRTQIQTWITGSAYDVRGDLDRNGVVDVADRAACSANSGKNLAWGKLSYSATGNRRGYCGYVADFVTPGLMHARCRVYASELGRWLTRDMAGFDAMGSLYAYVEGDAVGQIDPFGLSGVPPQGVQIPNEVDQPPGGLLAPPGSGLKLGFIECPTFERFGSPGMLPPGVHPVPSSEWVTPRWEIGQI